VDFNRVRQAKHVIGVRGGMVRGFSCADSTPYSGVRELRDELTAAMEEGHKRALLILDGSYQFVSIGVYVDKAKLVLQ
jgi:hypothetical protein